MNLNKAKISYVSELVEFNRMLNDKKKEVCFNFLLILLFTIINYCFESLFLHDFIIFTDSGYVFSN